MITKSKYKIRIACDKAQENLIRQRIKDNDGYCISKPRTEASKCMCAEFKNTEEGVCRCGLYIKCLNYD